MKTKIRALTTKDMFDVIAMLKKCAGSRLSSLLISDENAIKGKNDNEKAMSMGMLVLSELYDNLIDDLQAWFASLVEKPMGEYMAMPPETTLDIIDFLIDNEVAKSFFSRALQVYKKMSVLGNFTEKK